MAKIVVEIDFPDDNAQTLRAELENYKTDWFPLGDNRISVDKSYLKTDPTESSFYLFGFIEVRD